MGARLERDTITPSLRAPALFAAVVLTGLWLQEVRPQMEDRTLPWPGRAPWHLPTYLPGDCPFYRATIESLLHDGDLDLRNNAPWTSFSPATQVSLGARGEWYPKHPVALSIAALPFYAAFGDPGLLLFNLLELVALDLLLLALARRYASEEVALAAALLFAFGTLLRPVAYNFSPDVFSSLLAVSATLLLLERRPALAGLLLGLSVTAKWTNLVFLPLAALWTLWALGLRATVRLALAAAPPLLALGALNLRMFGTPFITPYDRVLTFAAGVPVIEPSHRQQFDLPFFSTLWKQIVDGKYGLLRSAPPVLLALPGFVLLFRRARADAILLASFFAAQIAVFAPYRQWYASNIGHRFLMTAIAISIAPAAATIEEVLHRGHVPRAGGSR